MIDKPKHYAVFDAPDLAPVIVTELTSTGWRGLTADGEILNVNAHINGKPLAIPSNIAISRGGETIGYRRVPKETRNGVIDAYNRHLNASTTLVRANEGERALAEIDAALAIAPTMLARYNRAMILMQLGRWREGLDDWARCEQHSPLFMRPQYFHAIERGFQPWYGEEIAGKKLLLIHDHGFGDTIMMLRFVPLLRAMGANVILDVPQELRRLACQVAPVVTAIPGPPDADYVCSIFLLMQVLRLTPEQMAVAPYLQVEAELVEKWKGRINIERKNIGVAWSVGVRHDDDYPRAAPLGLFCNALGKEGDLISVQQQGAAEADLLGVEHFHFEDFADCAALMSLMDEIVSVDTAAVHLAGAIGHPRISLLLSHWASWRWQSPLYQNVRFCRQETSGDWESAFAKRN